MAISTHILAILSLVFFAALSVRHFTHMFQLNSYTANVQLAWMKKNFIYNIPTVLLPVCAIVFAFISAREYAYAYGLLGLFAIVFALFYFPKKAKKSRNLDFY